MFQSSRFVSTAQGWHFETCCFARAGKKQACDPKSTSRLVASNDHIFDPFPNKYSVTPSSVSSYRSKMACLSHQSSSMSKPPCNCCDMAKGLKQPPLRTGFSLASTGHAGWPQPTRSSFYIYLMIFRQVRGNQRNISALQTAGCRDTPSRPSKSESIAQDQQTGKELSIFKRPPRFKSVLLWRETATSKKHKPFKILNKHEIPNSWIIIFRLHLVLPNQITISNTYIALARRTAVTIMICTVWQFHVLIIASKFKRIW